MTKKVSKKKTVRIPVVLIIIILIIVGGVVFKNKKDIKNNEQPQNTVEQTNENKNTEEIEEVEEYVQVLEDGTKLNISTKLKENKTIGGLVLKDIQLTCKNGVTNLLANVENSSSETVASKTVEITLVDENEEEIYTLRGIIEEVEAGGTKKLNSSITADFANAYDFIIKEK